MKLLNTGEVFEIAGEFMLIVINEKDELELVTWES